MVQNMYPTSIETKTDRINNNVASITIENERLIINEFISLSSELKDHPFFFDSVIATYDKIKRVCAVHTWKKNHKRLAMIICIFYVLGMKYNIMIPFEAMREITKCKVKDITCFMKTVESNCVLI